MFFRSLGLPNQSVIMQIYCIRISIKPPGLQGTFRKRYQKVKEEKYNYIVKNMLINVTFGRPRIIPGMSKS